ncbi:DNA polymerase III subunit delta [Listeria ilorinensis]|uniref:DNA polymerase III subunit delta n=1 Tax=Listeria ilorinensis TaxID=2867439 RepID=UPI001EF74D8C|nr:DNA polymerase III subunit delta [Listeria ilorinensis]
MLAEWKKIESGQLAPVYLIIGTEDYIINESKKRILAAGLSEEEQSFNYAHFDLEETPIELVMEEAETLPFFGERRIVLASNPVFLTTEKTKSKIEHHTDKFARYLESPAEYTIFIIVARVEKLDERKKLTKQLKKVATIIEAKKPDEKEFLNWLKKAAEQSGYRMEQHAVDRLYELTSGNLTAAMNELDKLLLYKFEEKEIGREDVERLVVRSLEQNIFLLLDKMIAMDISGALRIYYDLLKQKEEPIKIIALIASQFRLLNQIKILERQGYSSQQIASKLKVHPFRVKIATKQARNFSAEDLQAALLRLAEIDLELKTGYGNREQKLEWFLFELEDRRKASLQH